MGGQITQPHAKVSGSHGDLSLKSLEETENMIFSQNVKLELYFRFIQIVICSAGGGWGQEEHLRAVGKQQGRYFRSIYFFCDLEKGVKAHWLSGIGRWLSP